MTPEPNDNAADGGNHRSSRRLFEWLSCSVVHYTGLDRMIAPLHRRAGQLASIVMYHRVHADGPGPGWRLTQSAFRAQLRHLTRHYRVLHMAELAERLASGAPLPSRAVAVTFDDGYRDNFTQAFPVIEETACPTTIFLTAGLIGTRQTLWWDALLDAVLRTARPRAEVERVFHAAALPPPDWRGPDVEAAVLVLKRRPEGEMQRATAAIAAELGVDPAANTGDHMMRWEEARRMVDSGLVTMGAHSVTHRNLKKLALDEVREEVTASKRIIEEQLGCPARLFAYPFGNPANDYSEAVKAIVREAGFSCAVTVVLGMAEQGSDLYEIPRFCESAERWQGPAGRFSRALFDAYLTGARDALGALRPDRWLLRRSA